MVVILLNFVKKKIFFCLWQFLINPLMNPFTNRFDEKDQ